MSSFFPDFKKERKKKLKNGSRNCQSDLEVRSSKWVPRKSERNKNHHYIPEHGP